MRDLSNYGPRQTPGAVALRGQYVVVQPIDWALHGTALFNAISLPGSDDTWTYMPFKRFRTPQDLQHSFELAAQANRWEVMVICEPSAGKPLGTASYMRLREDHGSCEVGCIVFGEELKQSRAATEAMYLMAEHAFGDLGYRRYEWKCDNNNAASKQAALRFGFVYEGLFRNDRITKDKNRDTAWFSITDAEWPQIKHGFTHWLNPENFDVSGRQIKSLVDLRRKA